MKVSMVKDSGSSSPPAEGAVEVAGSSASGVATGVSTGAVALPLGTGAAEGTVEVEGVEGVDGVEGVEEPPEPKRAGPGTV